MSGGTTTQDSQSTSVNQIPAWMTQAGQQNYGFAQQVAEQPLQQYQGQMVADTSPQTQQSWNVAANSGNVGSDQYNAGTAGYLGALGQTPANVTAGQISNTNLDPYMNPYTQDVINATLPGMQQANALSQNQQANAANSSNAFGGSRQGIQQGVAQAQGAMNIGQMLAGLNSANFTQAQAAATGDINRRLTADQGNQQAQQAKITSDIAASQGLGNLGDSMNKANVANYGLLSSAGASQSMQAQNEINAQMAKFSQAFNYPQQQLGTLLSALGMTPHDTSTSGQQSQQTTTPTDWASLISGGIKDASSIFGMMPSDKTLKKDITPAGKGPAGIPVYKFRYKGALAGSPKQQGPMAQDVQKVVPQAVSQIPGSGGKLQIHMPTLAAATEPRGYAKGTSFVPPSPEPPSSDDQSGWNKALREAPLPSWWDKRPVENSLPLPPQGYAAGTPNVKPNEWTPVPPPPDDTGWNQALKEAPLPPGWENKISPENYHQLLRGYAAGTPFVQPSLAGFAPPSSPGVAKGIGAMSAFRPPMKLPRGATVAPMPKHFAFGTSNVAPDMNDVDLGMQIEGGGGISDFTDRAKAPEDSPPPARKPPPEMMKPPSSGWGAPSMGYAISGFASGSPQVPGFGSTDTVPSYLTPGEAVLTPGAAQHVGRTKIAALNAMHPPGALSTFMPPVASGQATTALRAGARGIKGALANTKLRPKMAGGLSG